MRGKDDLEVEDRAREDDSDGMTLISSLVRPWVRSVQRGLSALEGEHQEIG